MVVSVNESLRFALSCTSAITSSAALELAPEPEPEDEIEVEGSDSSRSMYEVQLVVCFPRGGRTSFLLVGSPLEESLLIGEALWISTPSILIVYTLYSCCFKSCLARMEGQAGGKVDGQGK